MTSTADPAVTTRRVQPVDDVVVFSPYRAGIPNLRRYLTDAWGRRHFAFELARTELRAMHFNTAFGMIWLVLNPLLLTGVYYVLTSIIGRTKADGGGVQYLDHIMAGLFAYYMFMQAASHASNSVVKGGKLIMNTAFPKVLLPLSSVVVAIMRFLPTLAIYFLIHALARQPFDIGMVSALAAIAELVLFATGFAMLVAALNVYFRDLKSFLPYLLRIWLYVSPILWYGDDIPHRLEPLKYVNPLFPILDSWNVALGTGQWPSWRWLVAGALWGIAAVIVGGYVFISRERDFAVRI